MLDRRLAATLALALLACGGGPASTAAPATALAATAAPPEPVTEVAHFPPDWPYHEGTATPHSARGMVSSDSTLGTKVGVQILASGGNAVDAAVATAFAMAVAFPTAGNLGGGGFIVARVRGKAFAIDFRETAPAAATRDMYLGPDGKPTRDSRDGWRSVGVPGSVAGLYEAWHELGSQKKTWAELLAPAIELAEKGFAVDEDFTQDDRLAPEAARELPRLRGALPAQRRAAAGRVDLEGSRARGGAAAHRRAGAKGILRGARRGDLRARDEGERRPHHRGRPPRLPRPLAHPRRVRLPPAARHRDAAAVVGRDYDGHDRPPARGVRPARPRLALARARAPRRRGDAQGLRRPQRQARRPRLREEPRRRAALARVGREAARDHPDGQGDAHGRPLPGPQDRARGPQHHELLGRRRRRQRGGADDDAQRLVRMRRDGAGLGFVLNDEMDDFASVPGTANMFGLVQGEPNAIAPGKRMLSSMSPSIVVGAGGRVEAVLGAAGGSRIITAVFEELSNLVDFQMDVGDAVRAPRFHQQDSPDVILLEPRALPEDVVKALTAMGHATKETEHLADAPGIGRDHGLWAGAAEPRREGGLALGL